jgi:hypothetical protein
VIKKSAFKGDISKIEKLNEREFRNSMRNVNDEDEPVNILSYISY